MANKHAKGRPPAEDPINARFEVRTTADRLKAYKAKAKAEGKTFSQWVRAALDRALKRKS